MTGKDRQEAEVLAAHLESAARALRNAVKGAPRGVHLHRAKIGYTVNVDGLDLGLETGWSDADALCQAIATRRPKGDESGYGVNFHHGTPFGVSSRGENTVTLGVSVLEKVRGDG